MPIGPAISLVSLASGSCSGFFFLALEPVDTYQSKKILNKINHGFQKFCILPGSGLGKRPGSGSVQNVSGSGTLLAEIHKN